MRDRSSAHLFSQVYSSNDEIMDDYCFYRYLGFQLLSGGWCGLPAARVELRLGGLHKLPATSNTWHQAHSHTLQPAFTTRCSHSKNSDICVKRKEISDSGLDG